MITRRHRVKLLAFGLIAVVSVGYVGGKYAGLDRLFGSRGYVVTAQLADSGGIFVNAEVTYRGVSVGRVAAMRLDEQGVAVDLDIDSGTEIPAASQAVVADRSAVGEQYVDLRPSSEEGPYLHDGSVIERAKTALPVSPDTVLANLDQFVSSVDPASLRTVVDETYDAFAGRGPDLQQLLDTAGSFTDSAAENLPQTQKLLSDGRTVLATQERQAQNITSLAAGLRQIAGQLKTSDPDLRKVVDEAPQLADDVDQILSVSGSDLGVLVANLLTTMQVTSVRTDAIEEQLVALPVISAFTRSVWSNGEGHLGLVLNFFDPHSCTKGYETTKERPANDTSEAPANTQAYCAEPPGSPTGVRGAQNAPYAGVPVTPAKTSSSSPAVAQQQAQLPGLLGLLSGPGATGIGQLLGLPG
ncbi:phospholipid/cholesterol/gamma-HCH transport system substrate-binding protein [Amycolatopsis bartoniae]|uniref:ABC transporter substrate-binding protein n=1 Tax=Amycolatopsis bartoniae TaxID=941986 RepID=A0A8H9IZB5_9PSEU|nr:MlaD family protein [Amycolatopsis bartoniae]MBB2937543.1 phospholipid/cholesterol/gamma-HCH transport system substrate-binding protein [Amycolatopsis bartoniae]TVT05940.1 MCE family protein [Amycolatopsis bartoniae]GHF82066.1 ABC transporter substrate-binding protein [Amycolatopsis bartoniae]